MKPEQSPKFSVYAMLCKTLIWHLRLLSVPIEMLSHIDVGERYFGFSGLLAVLLIGADAWWEGSSMLYLLMTMVVLRVISHRVWCFWSRTAGYPPVNSRSAGRPLLGVFVPQIPEIAMRWIEPVLVMIIALVLSAINSTMGGYLMWSGFALLGVTIARASLSYNEMLDRLDAGIVPALPVTSIQNGIPDRMVFDRIDAHLLDA